MEHGTEEQEKQDQPFAVTYNWTMESYKSWPFWSLKRPPHCCEIPSRKTVHRERTKKMPRWKAWGENEGEVLRGKLDTLEN